MNLVRMSHESWWNGCHDNITLFIRYNHPKNVVLVINKTSETFGEITQFTLETFLENKTEVVWPLLEARTQPHLCDIAKT